jgi:hypothetical protein
MLSARACELLVVRVAECNNETVAASDNGWARRIAMTGCYPIGRSALPSALAYRRNSTSRREVSSRTGATTTNLGRRQALDTVQ